MRKGTQNTFGKGMNKDLSPLTTPNDVLTDCVNGSVITYNGDEFVLQTDLGNTKVYSEGGNTAIPENFMPLGMKEFNGVIYMVIHNPLTKETQIGSLPSPQRYTTFNSDTSDVTKTIPQLDADTSRLKNSFMINHNMNLLNSYLTSGDKFTVCMKIQNTGSHTTSEILEKLINNYSSTSVGYFNFEYYIMSSNGDLTALNLDILNDIKYLNLEGNTGTRQVYTEISKGIITLIIKACSISTFDFTATSYTVGDVDPILKAKIQFKTTNITSDTAITVKTIKIDYNIAEGINLYTGTRYFDYESEKINDTMSMYIEKYDDSNNLITFADNSFATITCTPIDQFGRELTDMIKIKTFILSTTTVSPDSHTIFQYKTSGNTISLTLNYLYEGPNSTIDKLNLEFYDPWSDVSFTIPNLSFTDVNNRILTHTIDLSNDYYTNRLLFNDTYRGGIPVTSLTNYTGTGTIFGKTSPKKVLTFTGSPFLRKNHTYILRIYGTENSINYNVIQLLYTTGVFDDVTDINNFNTIDIVSKLKTNSVYNITTTKTGLFADTSIVYPTSTLTSTTYNTNYLPDTNHPNPSIYEVYRIYGGEVWGEYSITYGSPDITNIYAPADGTSTKKYRNLYRTKNLATTNQDFYDYNTLATLGYHNVCDTMYIDMIESAVIGSNRLISKTKGTGSNSNLSFIATVPDMIKSPLKSGTSIKDFYFRAIPKYIYSFEDKTGIVSLSHPYLVGIVDATNMTKSISVNNTQISSSIANISQGYSSTSISFYDSVHGVGSDRKYLFNLSSWQGLTDASDISFTPNQSFTNVFNVNSSSNNVSISVNTSSLSTERLILSGSELYLLEKKTIRLKSLEYFSKVRTYSYISTGFKTFSDITSVDVDNNYTYFRNLRDFSSANGYKIYNMDNVAVTAVYNEVGWSRNLIMIQAGDLNFDTSTPLTASISITYPTPTTTFSTGDDISVYPSSGTLRTFYSAKHPIYSSMFKVDSGSSSRRFYCHSTGISSKPYYPANTCFLYTSYAQESKIDSYVRNFCIKKAYTDVVILHNAQSNHYAFNVDTSISDITIIPKLSLFLNTNSDSKLSYLDKVCLGTSDLVPFNVTNIREDINSAWIPLIDGAIYTSSYGNERIIYNTFDLTLLSVGNQLNIPYNFSSGESFFSTTLQSLTYRVSVGIPSNLKTAFTSAYNNATLASRYLDDDIFIENLKSWAVKVRNSTTNGIYNPNVDDTYSHPSLNYTNTRTHTLHGEIPVVALNTNDSTYLWGAFNFDTQNDTYFPYIYQRDEYYPKDSSSSGIPDSNAFIQS